MIDWLMSLLGMGRSEFGNLSPDDVDGYYRASHEIDQAERQGPTELAAAFARYGLKNEDHWDEVRGAFARRHQHNPDFMHAAARVGMQMQMQSVAHQYQFPQGYLDPIEGVSLEQLAQIQATIETQGQQAAFAKFGLDGARFERINGGWQARMGGGADAMAAQILSGQYHTYLAQSRAFVARGAAF